MNIPARFRFWFLMISGTGLYFLANIQRVAIPGSIFDSLQKELDVSAPFITALGSSFMYTYAGCQLVIGLLVDRYGGNRVIAYGAVLFCLGSLLLPFSSSLPVLYTSRALTGLGASALYLSLVKEAMGAFDRNFTIVLSLIILTGYAGGIVAGAPFVAYVSVTDWRHVMLVTALLTVAFYLLFLLAYTGAKHPPVRMQPFTLAPLRTLLAIRHNRHVFLFCGINFGLYYVLQTVIGKKFLEDFCGMSPSRAALILSLMGLIAALSGFGVAVASRLLGNRRRIFLRIAGSCCLLVFTAITALVIGGVRTEWLAALLCLLAFTASTSAIAVPLLRETNLAEHAGASVSLLNFTCYMTVALLGNAVGVLMNLYPPEQQGDVLVYGASSWIAVFGVMLVLSVVVAWCAFTLKETMGRTTVNVTDPCTFDK